MKVLVTGANGFLGSHICRLLYKEKHIVHALYREGSDVQYVKKHAHRLIASDYSEEALRIELEQCDALVHVAAKASDWGEYRQFEKANIELATRVHRIANSIPNLHIIHISTNAVIGEEDCTTKKNEDSPYHAYLPYFLERFLPSGMNHYKTSKEMGERAIRKIHAQNNHQLMILRPVWIFGPREFNAGPYEYLKTVSEGIPLMPGRKHNLFHTVYVEDVARAVLQGLTKLSQGQLQAERIYLIGPENVLTMDQFYSKLCQQIKKRKPLDIPYWPLLIPVTLLESIYLLLRIKTPPLLTRARLYMLYASNVYDVTKAKEELGFIADTDIDYAIRKTVKWWKTYKYL